MSSIHLQTTKIAGLDASVTQGADGRPPILFIHGAFVTHESFAGWQEEFARLGWGGVAFSNRGRLGAGPERAAGLAVADYVEDALSVIDAMGETPVVMGHSLGGLVAQKIMEAGKSRAAVLLAPAPAAMLTAQPVAIPSYLPMLPDILAGRPFLPPAGTCGRIVLNGLPKEAHKAVHGSLVHESGKVYREMMFGQIKVDAAKVHCPVLVIGAENDRIISPGLAAATARRFHAELRMLKNHAHLFIAEPGWEKIAAETASWLDRYVMAQPLERRAA